MPETSVKSVETIHTDQKHTVAINYFSEYSLFR